MTLNEYEFRADKAHEYAPDEFVVPERDVNNLLRIANKEVETQLKAAFAQIEHDIEKHDITRKSAELTGDAMYVHGVQHGIDQVLAIARIALKHTVHNSPTQED